MTDTPKPQRGDWVLVPREPTAEMVVAALHESGQAITAYTAPRKSGVATDGDISEAEALEINRQLMDAHADTYRAMLNSAPPPAMESERGEFEAWAVCEGFRTDKDNLLADIYANTATRFAWSAWQARSARTTDAGAGNGGLEEAAEYHDNAAKEIRAAVDAPNFDGNEYRHLEAIADHEMFAADFRTLKDIAAHSAPAALPTLTEEERGQIVVAECLSESPYGSLSHAVIAGSMKQLLAIIDRLTGPAK